MRDLASNIGIVQAVAPQVLTATTKSTAIDLLGFNAAAVVINTGAIVSSGNFTPKLQESDTTTDGDFTDVDASNLIGTLPTELVADAAVKQSYIGDKRYIRAVLTLNSGTSIAADVIAVLGDARNRPVA